MLEAFVNHLFNIWITVVAFVIENFEICGPALLVAAVVTAVSAHRSADRIDQRNLLTRSRS